MYVNETETDDSAVAEAWVSPDHKNLYASAEGLGQTFSFDLLVCEWETDKLKETINNALKDTKTTGSSTTWVFSNHDVSVSALCWIRLADIRLSVTPRDSVWRGQRSITVPTTLTHSGNNGSRTELLSTSSSVSSAQRPLRS